VSGHGPPVEVAIPVRLGLGPVSEVVGELQLHTDELTDPPTGLPRPEVRAALAELLEAVAAELRHPTA
jgi:hypothetical protein